MMLATVAGLALAGAALAQPKPGSQATTPALPTAKPPPLGAPGQAQPTVPRAPAAPPVAQPTLPRAPAAPPVAQAPAPPIPANEPAALTRFRSLIGADVRFSYANAQVLDAAGEQVRVTGVVMTDGDKRATAEELTLNGLREDGVAEALVRGFATAESGTQVRIALLRVAGLTVPRSPGGAPPEPDQVRLDSLRIEGLETSGANTVRLRVLTFENWAAGQPTRFALEGLEASGMDSGMVDGLRLARFAFGGTDLPGLIAAVMRGQQPRNLVGRASVELDALELTGGGRPVGGLASVRLGADTTRPDGTGTSDIAFRGIRVEAVPMIATWLTRFGYQALQGDLTAATTYDGTTGRIEIRDLSLAVAEAGTLSLSLALDGLTQERMQAAQFDAARLIAFGLRYADASLLGRFIAAQSRETRTPEPQLREQFAAMAGGALSQPGAAALDPIRDAVQRLIRGQARTIEIRANPPRPLGVGDMQGVPPNPAEAQRMLGITATAQ
jgi:hypothetical protein